MEHIEIEKKINEILKPLEMELKESGAMDLTGRAIDEKAFESIIDKKIAELQKLEPLISNEAGVAVKGYAPNILFHHIEMLNDMRNHHTFSVRQGEESLQRGEEIEKKLLKRKSFLDGIMKLLQRISGRKRTDEKSR